MFWKINAHSWREQLLPLPDEHLGLGKWFHSALFRREKRILWLQTTLSVNILQLSARLSDDKPHAARRAANLPPYGHHFIVIFHGRNVNGRCLLQPSLTAPLSTLKRGHGWAGPTPPVYSPLQGCEAVARPSPCPPTTRAPASHLGGAHWGRGPEAATSFFFFFFGKIRTLAASPRTRGGKQGGRGREAAETSPDPGPPSTFLPSSGQGWELEGQAKVGLGGPGAGGQAAPAQTATQWGPRPVKTAGLGPWLAGPDAGLWLG